MSTSLVGALGARFPDSTVLFDDTFENGFCGWQPLYTPQAENAYTTAPLTLSHPSLTQRALVMTTNSVIDPGVGSQGVAMKRLGYWDEPGIVDLEVWFAYGGESATGHGPRDLLFMVDEMYAGDRRFWKARWRNVNDADPAVRPMNWYLASGAEDTFLDTGLTTNFPFNGNKGSQSYVKLSVDLKNKRYLSLAANRDRFDLTSVPGVTAPTTGPGGNFDDPLFENGLNFMIAVRNRGSQPFHSWMGCTRVRATFRKAA